MIIINSKWILEKHSPLLKVVRLLSTEEYIVFGRLSYDIFNINLGTWSHCRCTRYMVQLGSHICGTKTIRQCYSNGKEKVLIYLSEQSKVYRRIFVVLGCNEFITFFLTFNLKFKKKCFEYILCQYLLIICLAPFVIIPWVYRKIIFPMADCNIWCFYKKGQK